MDARQQTILSAVVSAYAETGFPVASELVVREFLSSVSGATVRADMAQMEEDGYLYQPHPSAGRIPTDMGYRYFVEALMEEEEFSRSEEARLREEIIATLRRRERISRKIAKILSEFSGVIGVSGETASGEFYDCGLREILRFVESEEREDLCRLSAALDDISGAMGCILEKVRDNEVKIFIGSENPANDISGYSMIVSPFQTSEGDRTVLALIGPKRMHYARNVAIVERIAWSIKQEA